MPNFERLYVFSLCYVSEVKHVLKHVLSNLTNLHVYSDINECNESPCSSNAQCQNTAGSYRCICDRGYELVGSKCQGNQIIRNS